MSHFLKIKMYGRLCQKYNKLAYFDILYQINKIPLVNIWKGENLLNLQNFKWQKKLYTLITSLLQKYVWEKAFYFWYFLPKNKMYIFFLLISDFWFCKILQESFPFHNLHCHVYRLRLLKRGKSVTLFHW